MKFVTKVDGKEYSIEYEDNYDVIRDKKGKVIFKHQSETYNQFHSSQWLVDQVRYSLELYPMDDSEFLELINNLVLARKILSGMYGKG